MKQISQHNDALPGVLFATRISYDASTGWSCLLKQAVRMFYDVPIHTCDTGLWSQVIHYHSMAMNKVRLKINPYSNCEKYENHI